MALRLPLSGATLAFREPDGACEAAIADLPVGRPVAAGIALLDRLVIGGDGDSIDAGSLVVTDFEAALVALRIAHGGDAAVSAPSCAACGERVEIAFSLTALAAAARPRRGPEVIDGIAYRLPQARDLAAVEALPTARRQLLAACIAGAASVAQRNRIETAMAQRAPLLSRIVTAACAACTVAIDAVIHVPSFVVGEFTWRARGVFDDVHRLAQGYGWDETAILSLPRARRQRYAALLRAGG